MIQLFAEAVDDEIFERGLRLARNSTRPQITESDLHGARQAQSAQCLRGELDGVVEKFAQKINSALARTDQHDEIIVLGIELSGRSVAGLTIGRLNRPLLVLIADGYRAALAVRADGRHHIEPPLHNAVGLGKESVAADVHAVALVADGARDAADLIAGFEHNGMDIRMPLQLQCRRQPGGTGADNNCCFSHTGMCCVGSYLNALCSLVYGASLTCTNTVLRCNSRPRQEKRRFRADGRVHSPTECYSAG